MAAVRTTTVNLDPLATVPKGPECPACEEAKMKVAFRVERHTCKDCVKRDIAIASYVKGALDKWAEIETRPLVVEKEGKEKEEKVEYEVSSPFSTHYSPKIKGWTIKDNGTEWVHLFAVNNPPSVYVWSTSEDYSKVFGNNGFDPSSVYNGKIPTSTLGEATATVRVLVGIDEDARAKALDFIRFAVTSKDVPRYPPNTKKEISAKKEKVVSVASVRLIDEYVKKHFKDSSFVSILKTTSDKWNCEEVELPGPRVIHLTGTKGEHTLTTRVRTLMDYAGDEIGPKILNEFGGSYLLEREAPALAWSGSKELDPFLPTGFQDLYLARNTCCVARNTYIAEKTTPACQVHLFIRATAEGKLSSMVDTQDVDKLASVHNGRPNVSFIHIKKPNPKVELFLGKKPGISRASATPQLENAIKRRLESLGKPEVKMSSVKGDVISKLSTLPIADAIMEISTMKVQDFLVSVEKVQKPKPQTKPPKIEAKAAVKRPAPSKPQPARSVPVRSYAKVATPPSVPQQPPQMDMMTMMMGMMKPELAPMLMMINQQRQQQVQSVQATTPSSGWERVKSPRKENNLTNNELVNLLTKRFGSHYFRLVVARRFLRGGQLVRPAKMTEEKFREKICGSSQSGGKTKQSFH